MTRTLFTAIFLTLFSQAAWGLTEREFSQALYVAKLDAAVLKARDNCQSEIGKEWSHQEAMSVSLDAASPILYLITYLQNDAPTAR